MDVQVSGVATGLSDVATVDVRARSTEDAPSYRRAMHGSMPAVMPSRFDGASTLEANVGVARLERNDSAPVTLVGDEYTLFGVDGRVSLVAVEAPFMGRRPIGFGADFSTPRPAMWHLVVESDRNTVSTRGVVTLEFEKTPSGALTATAVVGMNQLVRDPAFDKRLIGYLADVAHNRYGAVGFSVTPFEAQDQQRGVTVVPADEQLLASMIDSGFEPDNASALYRKMFLHAREATAGRTDTPVAAVPAAEIEAVVEALRGLPEPTPGGMRLIREIPQHVVDVLSRRSGESETSADMPLVAGFEPTAEASGADDSLPLFAIPANGGEASTPVFLPGLPPQLADMLRLATGPGAPAEQATPGPRRDADTVLVGDLFARAVGRLLPADFGGETAFKYERQPSNQMGGAIVPTDTNAASQVWTALGRVPIARLAEITVELPSGEQLDLGRKLASCRFASWSGTTSLPIYDLHPADR